MPDDRIPDIIVIGSSVKVVGLDGKPIPPPAATNPTIIMMLEEALAAAMVGKVTALAIATVMADGSGGTAIHADAGFHSGLLANIAIMQSRHIATIEKG